MLYTTMTILLFLVVFPNNSSGEEIDVANAHSIRETGIQFLDTKGLFNRFRNESAYNFEYPDAVRGIYVSANSVGSLNFDTLVKLVDSTDLNTMVIDVKNDYGNLTFQVEEDSPYKDIAKNTISNPQLMMERLEEKNIYPIARVVVFKDSVLANKRPDLSFVENGNVWQNGGGESFVNPFEKEVWEYNVEIAKMAAEMGFQEIQFDYVRFPEGFEKRAEKLTYSLGDYENIEMNQVKKRVEAVTNFVAYAKEELEDYDVDVSVDIFGYAATLEETPGIGQNFSRISENVDIISSMIYPSHWSKNFFGIEMPDREPYRLVSEYANVENQVLEVLDTPPTSRPWLQDFEAPWLYSGKTKPYGKEEVEAQISALYDNGIDEFLLWNAGNKYTADVDYLVGKH